MQNNYHEMQIKLVCAQWLERNYGADVAGFLINEFSANKSSVRADLVYVSQNEIVAVEIKSSKDKITRLENQVKFLKKLYNRVDVITTTKHLMNARAICARENVGLHLISEKNIETVLKGRSRRIDPVALQKLIFPLAIRQKKNFVASEEQYRIFLLKKYGSTNKAVTEVQKLSEIDASYIRNLNPHHVRRAQLQRRKMAYQNDLRELVEKIQSTQSSSNSSLEMSTP
jgi:hypothetical protein